MTIRNGREGDLAHGLLMRADLFVVPIGRRESGHLGAGVLPAGTGGKETTRGA